MSKNGCALSPYATSGFGSSPVGLAMCRSSVAIATQLVTAARAIALSSARWTALGAGDVAWSARSAVALAARNDAAACARRSVGGSAP